VPQDIVSIEQAGVEEAGYGKDGKLKNAFHFPTTAAAASEDFCGDGRWLWRFIFGGGSI
jgi:hypothetical protein